MDDQMGVGGKPKAGSKLEKLNKNEDSRIAAAKARKREIAAEKEERREKKTEKREKRKKKGVVDEECEEDDEEEEEMELDLEDDDDDPGGKHKAKIAAAKANLPPTKGTPKEEAAKAKPKCIDMTAGRAKEDSEEEEVHHGEELDMDDETMSAYDFDEDHTRRRKADEKMNT